MTLSSLELMAASRITLDLELIYLLLSPLFRNAPAPTPAPIPSPAPVKPHPTRPIPFSRSVIDSFPPPMAAMPPPVEGAGKPAIPPPVGEPRSAVLLIPLNGPVGIAPGVGGLVIIDAPEYSYAAGARIAVGSGVRPPAAGVNQSGDLAVAVLANSEPSGTRGAIEPVLDNSNPSLANPPPALSAAPADFGRVLFKTLSSAPNPSPTAANSITLPSSLLMWDKRISFGSELNLTR